MAEPTEPADDRRDSPEEQYTKKQFSLLLYRLRQLPAKSRAKVQSAITGALLDETCTVETPAGPVAFVPFGKVATGRALSMLTKQPATIQWIDAFTPDSVFWDVGANVGVYSLYAALRRNVRVVAIEPAAVNYFLLAANCEANRLDSRVDCLLLGLGGKRSIGRFEVSQFSPGGSFSARTQPDHPQPARQTAVVLSIDELVEEYEMACPNYIKIDAPGMSEAIVTGGMRTLQRPDVREVHIELREQSRGGPRIMELLDRAGFVVAGRHEHGGGTADMTFKRRR